MSAMTLTKLAQLFSNTNFEVSRFLVPTPTQAELDDVNDPINTLDKYFGKMVMNRSIDEAMWAENASPAGPWIRARGVPVATGAQIADIAHHSNTVGKFQGRQIYDTAGQVLYIADGPADDDTWTLVDGVGATQVTPS